VSGNENEPALDPVVQVALRNISDWTFEKRGRWYEYYKQPPMTLVDSSSRSYAIHTFKGLKHHGYAFDPQAVLHWCQDHGWPPDEAVLLSDYAAGVAAGIRYHTGPSPFGLLDIDELRRQASDGHKQRPGHA